MITDPWFYAAAIPSILLVGISKGGFGSGAGMFATPLIALTIPIPQAAAILLPILCVMDLAGLWAYRGTWNKAVLRTILAGGVLGVLLGALGFRYFDESVIRILLGAMALGFVLHRYAYRANLQAALPSQRKGFVCSVFSGVTSTVAHAGGPPLSIYILPLRMEKSLMVGTTVVFFAVINFVKLVPYAWLGLFDARNLTTSLVLIPLAPLGIWMGVNVMRRIPEALFYRICYTILVVVGARLLWDGVRGLQGAN